MGEVKCGNNVCEERFKNYDEKIEELKISVGKLESKMVESERNVDKIDNALSIKLIQIESKFEMYNKITSDKIDTFAKDIKENSEKVEKKMDKYINSLNETSKPQDSFKEWLQRFGMKMFETAIYAGIIYAVLSNKFK